ncbi:MAG: hypothetical protein HQL54_08235 [Magnetococcales bacterium]|nr:hypothetical protein [Magnetococcales bacterium]
MLYCIAAILILGGSEAVEASGNQTSFSEVYAEAVWIHKELSLIQRHMGVSALENVEQFNAVLKPHHVMAKSYLVLVKLNIFRSNNGLPRITPNALEPVRRLNPALVYGQTQRILTELRIIKRHFGINGQTPKPDVVPGKKPIDVFNRLHAISLDLDALNNQQIDPPYVFAEVMRLYEDVSYFLRQLGIKDNTFPPARQSNIIPGDSFKVSFGVMKEIQRIQRILGASHTSFSAFDKQQDVVPSDVFNMVSMCLAEFQIVKAHMKITRITPAAHLLTNNKTPDDIYQLLRWIRRKLRLVQADTIQG